MAPPAKTTLFARGAQPARQTELPMIRENRRRPKWASDFRE